MELSGSELPVQHARTRDCGTWQLQQIIVPSIREGATWRLWAWPQRVLCQGAAGADARLRTAWHLLAGGAQPVLLLVLVFGR